MTPSLDTSATVRECREILRNLATPQRLRSNPLAQKILERSEARKDPRRAFSAAVYDALNRLDPHDRRILERCDIDREIHSVVAADMAISERHLYRERHRIFESFTALLLASPDRHPVTLETVDSIEQLVKTARALEENGAASVAAEIIERRALECVDPIERARLFMQLAELHARSGASMRADECVDIASRNVASDAQRTPILEAEIAFTRAFVIEQGGEAEPVVAELAERSIHFVRSTRSPHYGSGAAGILVRALALRTQAACFTGDVEAIRATVHETCAALPYLRATDADSQIAALFSQSHAKVFCENDLDAGAQLLGQAIGVAQDAGLSVSSILLAVNLASIYRLQRDPARAARMLMARLDVARALGNRKALGALLVELAIAYADMRDFARAKLAVDEAAGLVAEDRSLQAPFLRASATIHLRTNLFRPALDEARAAEVAYAALGKSRLVGSSLTLQADVLHATGDRRAALVAIRNAIDALSARGHRLVLARAYELLGAISGNARHIDTARRLGQPR
jgi:tetratricopeptide (TPR) repeat protein